jgi:hypothetical protein
MLCSAIPSACHNLTVLSSAADAMRPLDDAAALQHSSALYESVPKAQTLLPSGSHAQKHQEGMRKFTHNELCSTAPVDDGTVATQGGQAVPCEGPNPQRLIV